ATRGFQVLTTRAASAADTFRVTGLQNLKPYYFRLAGFVNPTELSFYSAAVVSEPGAFTAPVDTFSLDTATYEAGDADWSPDGNWIAFGKSVGVNQSQIFAWSPVTRGLRQITQFDTPESWVGSVSWSPSGDRLAFEYSASLLNSQSDFRIWIVPSSGGPAVSVSPGRYDSDPAWDRSDSTMVFVRRFGDLFAHLTPELWKLELGAG